MFIITAAISIIIRILTTIYNRKNSQIYLQSNCKIIRSTQMATVTPWFRICIGLVLGAFSGATGTCIIICILQTIYLGYLAISRQYVSTGVYLRGIFSELAVLATFITTTLFIYVFKEDKINN